MFLIMVNDVIKPVNCLEVGVTAGMQPAHYKAHNQQ